MVFTVSNWYLIQLFWHGFEADCQYSANVIDVTCFSAANLSADFWLKPLRLFAYPLTEVNGNEKALRICIIETSMPIMPAMAALFSVRRSG
jgi:hypothetical protein